MAISALDFVCPICKAQPQEGCELSSGFPRFQSHIERKWLAQDLRRKLKIAEPPPSTEK
jgi:hypothetical protein